MNDYIITSDYVPAGDQPEAIRQLTEGIRQGRKHQTLLGVTGSGKTFTMANVIANINRPALILSHNKTLAAQLYSEFKNFFPHNAVEYFVSYYDYYQPEAYLPVSDTYIEKDMSINQRLEKLRLSATSSLLSGRSDVVVISSVSCMYGIGNPDMFAQNKISIKRGQSVVRDVFLRQLVKGLYTRNDLELRHGNFRVKGDTVDVFLAYTDYIIRVIFWGDEVDAIEMTDPANGSLITALEMINIYPANIFVTNKEHLDAAIDTIAIDLGKQVNTFKQLGKEREAKRLYERVTYDLEMLREMDYCSGIENYSRYLDGRLPGSRPFCLLDYFPKDYLLFIDESHVTLPQMHAMFGGDAARKKNLIEYGFRLPSAADNRPLQFEEFEKLINQAIYVSATPTDYETEKSEGIIVEQVVRPTGLLEPVLEVRPSLHQIDDLMEEIVQRREHDERTLVTTLTKRMAEELNNYLQKMDIRSAYIHSDVETLDRIRIMDDLRNGVFDVLIGVNLLREGLDLPQVSLVAIIDADKEGFLRNYRSLTQTAGRAARHLNGKVIMYADKITSSMQQTIDETARRRNKQLQYNEAHHLTPQAVKARLQSAFGNLNSDVSIYVEPEMTQPALDPVMRDMSPEGLQRALDYARAMLKESAAKLEYLDAARWRDEIQMLEKLAANQ
ncbi:MAG: excinuclease ABC subunit UvrB [Prevotellaceae bacterium]|jgi:excinuclease ABC subunit B|nr:excinuclease ABC subunit UvrB [Prevotellaceae bacterium]